MYNDVLHSVAIIEKGLCLFEFLHSTAYDNIFLLGNACQSILDAKVVSLICNEDTLKGRLQKDINEGERLPNGIDRSITRMELFQELDTVKVVTNRKTVKEIVDEIVAL